MFGIRFALLKIGDTDGNWSSAFSSTILLDTTPPSTTASPAGGKYNALTLTPVTLSCSDGTGSGCSNTYYTTNGSVPTISSTVYSGPINMSANTTLRYFSTDLAGNSEAVKTEMYTIDLIPPTGTISINHGAQYTN